MHALRSKPLRRFFVMVEQKGLKFYPEGTDKYSAQTYSKRRVETI